MWARGWTRLRGRMARQGRAVGSWRPGPAAASTGQGMTARVADMGTWAMGREGPALGGWAWTRRAGGALRAVTRSQNC